MSATDVLIAGQVGTTELAGMNLGANAWHLVILLFMGIGFATQPLVANQFGARSDGTSFISQCGCVLCLA